MEKIETGKNGLEKSKSRIRNVQKRKALRKWRKEQKQEEKIEEI